jgi:hypothetical protein
LAIIKSIPDPLLALGAIAVAAGGYTVYSLLQKSGATAVTISVYPKTIKNTADSYLTLQGQFDKSVSSAYYYVYEEVGDSSDSSGTTRHGHPVLQGKIGDSVTTFSVQIPTANLRYGNYTLVVSDTKLDTNTVVPLESSNSGESAALAQQDMY